MTLEDDLRAKGLLPPKPERRAPTTSRSSNSELAPYLRTALDGEVQTVLDAVEGQRNHLLNVAAYNLGQLVAGAGLPEVIVVEALTAAAVACGLDDGEIHATIRSGLDSGAQSPRGIPEGYTAATAYVLEADGSSTAPGTLTSRLLTRSQLGSLPQPEPLIASTIDKRTVVVLSGRRGKGKSLLALDWACSVATGRRWQSRDVDTAPVIWIAAEGAYGMHQRVDAWEQGWRQQVSDKMLFTLPTAVNLYTGRNWEEFISIAVRLKPGLVVFDTWARCTIGGSENDNSDATLATARLEALRELGATSLVIAHTDADDTKTRGATALEDNVDTVYRLKGEPQHLVLSRTKRKDGPEHDEVHLKLDACAKSVVIVSATAADMGGRTTDLMAIMSTHFGQTGCTKKELRDVAAENGITSSGTFTRAISSLISSGELVNTGSDARPFYRVRGNE